MTDHRGGLGPPAGNGHAVQLAETITRHPSRWIAVISVLVTLWMFIFTFVIPYVDRVTTREVRLSRIESDLKHLTEKVDLIYEHIIDNQDDE